VADRYWVGGSGDWDASTTTHWASSSGGAGGQSVPTSSDNVFFDSASHNANYTVTITAIAYSLSLTVTNPSSGKPTIDMSGQQIRAYGSISLVSGMTLTFTSSSLLGMYGASGTQTLNTNGVIIPRIYLSGASTKQLASDITINCPSPYAQFQKVSSATFDANSKKVTFTGGNTNIYMQSDTTFYDLVITGIASISDSFLIEGGNITVSNALTINGNSSTNRILVQSNALGTQRTITSASNTFTNVDFRDIKGAGAGSWDLSAITGGSGDCGGNTDITFTTADDWYWHEGTGNFSDYSKWYTATNGGGSQMASTRVPLPQDTCYFDSSSFDSGSQTITQDMPRIGGMDWTNATNTPAFSSSDIIYFFRSITFISGMTKNAGADFRYQGRVASTFNSGGLQIAQFNIQAIGGSLTLTNNLTLLSGRRLDIEMGTFDADTYDVSCQRINSSYSTARTILMGSGTWTFDADTSTIWGFATRTNLTFNAEQSTIKITSILTADRTIEFYAMTLNNFWNASTGDYYLTISSSNTFNNLKIDAGRKMKFLGGSDQNVTSITWEGTDGNLITLNSTNTTPWKISATSGTLAVKYCDIHYSTAEGGATFNALTSEGNVDGGNNTGWDFVGIIEKILTETITVSGSILKSMSRSLSESVIVTDVMSAIKIFAKTLTETILISDNMLKSISRTLTETVNVLDTKIASMSRLLLETITVEDSVSFIRTMNKVLTETIIVTGSLLRTIGKTFTETITTSDTLTKMRTKIKVLTETIVVTHLALLRSISRTFRETIIITSKFKIFLNGLNALWSNKFNKTGSTYTDKYPKKGTDHWSNKY